MTISISKFKWRNKARKATWTEPYDSLWSGPPSDKTRRTDLLPTESSAQPSRKRILDSSIEWHKGLEGCVTLFLFPTYTWHVKNESKGDSGILMIKLTEGTTPWTWKSRSNDPRNEVEGTRDQWWPLTPVDTAASGSPTGMIALSSTETRVTCWENFTAYSLAYFSKPWHTWSQGGFYATVGSELWILHQIDRCIAEHLNCMDYKEQTVT